MKCPFCGHLDTQVAETRVAEDGGFIRRRRRCGACGKRFTTYEKPEINFPVVVKKDGRRTEYAAAPADMTRKAPPAAKGGALRPAASASLRCCIYCSTSPAFTPGMASSASRGATAGFTPAFRE
jgi:hypothetical protein